ncbi:MAG: PEPxxWA-CTERM sorting domain-containing protein [Candidatus Sphingomonas colombiensis]|nr:PEPxxWA-CTERM sorting domain-containing protein [Sphingomonas sp.]WEK43428.1 MAG: PEPxxWA-CTERM sorting domain-containing protein [Sphingomonas sp.]
MRYLKIIAALAALSPLPAVAATKVLSDGNGTSATIYDDRAEWLAALGVGDLIEEDFADSRLARGLQLAGTDYELDGTLHQTLRNSANYLFMDFLGGAEALGFDFALVPTDVSQGLALTLRFDNSDIYTSITKLSGFYGIIGSAPLTNLGLEAARYRTQEYRIDNLAFRAAGVPEPVSWAMMVVGFGAVAGVMRRRRALAFA